MIIIILLPVASINFVYSEELMDQFRFLGNCPPTPPLS